MDNKNGFITVLGCMKCGRCDRVCNNEAITRIDGIARIDHEKCMACMQCVIKCPNKAIRYFE